MSKAPLLIPTDVAVELVEDDRPVLLKLSNDLIEVNVYCTLEEIDVFPQVADANWEARTTLQIGECLGAKAFWSMSDDRQQLELVISLDDDETWDIAVNYPASVLEEIVREIAAELDAESDSD